ncbi:hypothetical protein FS837_003236 [Tulasnella sp. UAMH 9824]|nr:hypothetical protein FS837_003236 [Tulasnella sp. UAMH 9824]
MLTGKLALYCRDKLVLLGLLLLFGAEMGVMGYCVSIATHLRLLPPFVGCIPIGRKPMGVAFYVAPLFTDTVIFVLTVVKTARYLRTNVRTALPRIVLRDGVLYFVLILIINMMNVVIYVVDPGSLRALGTSFSQVLTTILISRLQLNLLGESLRRRQAPTQRPDYSNAKQLSIEMRQVAIGSSSNHDPPPPPPPAFSSRNLARMLNAPPSAAIIGGAAPLMATNFPPPPSMGMASMYYPGGPGLGNRSIARAAYPSAKKRWCEEPGETARPRHDNQRTERRQTHEPQREDSPGSSSSGTLDHNVKATTRAAQNNPSRTDRLRLTRDAALSNRPSVPVSRVDLDGWHASTGVQ